jgi:hypothetical protein
MSLATATALVADTGDAGMHLFAVALPSALEAARIEERARSAAAAHYDSPELDDLPAPVQCYFRTVLEDGQPIIAEARVGTVKKVEVMAPWEGSFSNFQPCDGMNTPSTAAVGFSALVAFCGTLVAPMVV